MYSHLDNYLNPLLLRELRQLVRNRFIIVLINLFVAVLVFCCMMTVLFQDAVSLHGTGAQLFAWLSGIMTFTCFLAVVVYTGSTTANERINGDLMYASAMRPSSIVFGKLWSGAVLTVLLMSITAPFVMLAYLLRGLDIEMVVQSLLGTFVTIQVLNGLAICLFSNVKTKVQMSLMMGFGFFLFMILGGQIFSFFLMRSFGVGFSSVSSNWSALGWIFLSQGAMLAVFLSAAIALIAPPTSNRLLPVRITLTTIYLGSLVTCFYLSGILGYTESLTGWIYGWTGASIVLMLLVVSERESWSFRIRQTIPKNFLFRLVFFPFYSGSPCGLVWLALLTAGIFGIGVYFDSTLGIEPIGLFWLLFAFDYCVTALLLRSWFAPKSVTPDKTWTIVLFLLLAFTMGGILLFFLFYSSTAIYGDFYDKYSESWISALNPFLLDQNQLTTMQTTASVGWAIVLVPFLLFWLLCRVRFFSPYGSDSAMTLEQAIEAVRQADANPLVKGAGEQNRISDMLPQGG